MATINKYAGIIQIGITIVCFIFFVGMSYQQAQETKEKTDSCEMKIEKLAADQKITTKEINEVTKRLEVAVAKLEERLSFSMMGANHGN